MELFPVESPVSHDDIQDETPTLKNHGSTDPTVPDSDLDCDCHVSVRCLSQFSITPLMFIFIRRMTIVYCVRAGARSGTTFGM
jgi:hypothetical protein